MVLLPDFLKSFQVCLVYFVNKNLISFTFSYGVHLQQHSFIPSRDKLDSIIWSICISFIIILKILKLVSYLL